MGSILDRLRDELSQKGIHYIGVYAQESASSVNRYLKKKGFRQADTVVLDNGGIVKALNVYVIPRVLLIDKEHRVIFDEANVAEQKLRQALTEMQKEN